jgi:dTDP-4-dehydrorhamnose 3,5-epimerase-like enzyme
MSYIINLKTFSDSRGNLTPVDGVLPFEVKRFYYINNVAESADRGGHAHRITVEAIFCINGSFTVTVNDGRKRTEYLLDTPSKCVIVEPYEWHHIHNFSPGAVLMGVSSTSYDHSDYIHEEPELKP